MCERELNVNKWQRQPRGYLKLYYMKIHKQHTELTRHPKNYYKQVTSWQKNNTKDN